MNPGDQKKLFRAFAKQLEMGYPPTEEQTKYLIHIFKGIADGRDPSRILGLIYEDGKSKQDETSRANIDLVMHWIACATESFIDQNGKQIKPLTMKKAFEEGSIIAKKIFGVTDTNSYDPGYIKRKWHEYKKLGKARILRTAADADSIYEYTIPNPKK